MHPKSTETHELISALVDGEVAAAELPDAVAAASRTTEALRIWQTYQVVGQTLRGQAPAALACGDAFLAHFRERMATEVVVRPVPVDVLPPRAAEAALPVPAPSANDALIRWKLFAAAASLTAVAVFGWHVASLTEPSGTLAAAPASGANPSQVPVASTAAAAPVMLRDARLDALMEAHKQYGGTSALQMPAGFLRNATFDGSGR